MTFELPPDHCRTADDVRAAAARSRAFRREAWKPRPIVEAPPPEPEPIVEAVAVPPAVDLRELPICRSVRAVTLATAQHFGITYVDLISTRRALSRQRQIMFYVAKIATPFSLIQIGRRFKRDHTTVLYGCQVIQKLLDEGSQFATEGVAGIMGLLEIPWQPGDSPQRLQRIPGSRWSDDEVEHLKRCVLSGRYSVARIAEELRRPENGVREKMKKTGLKLPDGDA